MNMDDFREMATNNLARDIVEAIRCKVLNSEGKAQEHDWSDPYRRPGWAYGFLVMKTYRKCVRCGYRVRILRR